MLFFLQLTSITYSSDILQFDLKTLLNLDLKSTGTTLLDLY